MSLVLTRVMKHLDTTVYKCVTEITAILIVLVHIYIIYTYESHIF